MRAYDGAFFATVAAVVFAGAGCTGGVPKTTANKPIAKAAESAPAVEPRANASIEPADVAAAKDAPIHETDDNPVTSPESSAQSAQATPLANRADALPPPTVVPAAMPEVVLSSAHADDCLVRVGDKFPEVRLPDLMGRMRSWADLRGDALTVVVFWSGDRLLAADQLRYLDGHIARYRDLGVKAIAINVGQTPEQVRKTVADLDVATPVLLDIQRGLFSRVGRNHLPRTYLIDHEGAVLWFDIEFSRQTRENLEQAIHASLQST